jgi:RHS repeat-associated protein
VTHRFTRKERIYDGDGRRVTKAIPGGATTTYVYDAQGDLAAEYSTQPPAISCATCYLAVDHLGSTRLLTDQNGNPVSRHDFLPFGEELMTANRTPALGYGVTDNVMQKYTGKERDAETGLDYFGARYFSGAQRRFTSPDSPSFSKLSYPQTWNLYAYAVNNPLSYIDPTGHEIVCANNAQQCQADAAAATGNAEAAKRVSATTTTTQHSFLGIHWTTSKTNITISGDINSFRALGQNASRLADLVGDKQTVTVSYDQYAKASFWSNGIQLKGGATSYVPSQGYDAQGFIDPTRTRGAVYDPDAIAQGLPQANTGEEFGHEVLGHIWGELNGGHPAGTQANMRDSIAAEDAVRKLDPTRGQKAIDSHHNYSDATPDKR